ncbi:SDR family oxidoreductase [Tepidiforma sp.]|uniref:SDR family oxidoreductase n=1 Tax=Tepidiforma sp. TaxID=2682230 RepID=UPI002ADE0A11|nr:SDR family oxidoreductase [Tepidiforma sp.]
MNILVFGATGYIGSHLVPLLAARGHHVRAAARRLDVLEARPWADVERVAADALRPETLPAALAGIDVAYYLVHSMGGGPGFAARDLAAARSFRDAAAAAGVRRIIYLGGPCPAGPPSEHLASRLATGETLRQGPVPVTELRAGLIVGPGSAGFEVIRDLVNHLPVMITPRWTRNRTRPIALDDLLAYLLAVLDTPGTAGGIYDVAGPETLTFRDLLARYAAVTGRRFRAIDVPFLTPRLSSLWLALVTSVPLDVARPLVEGLKHDLLPDDAAIRAILPIPLHTYDEAVRAALERERSEPLPARWAEGALAFRGYNPDTSYYSRGETTVTPVRAPAETTWEVVRAIGGRTGYYYATPLWWLRGQLDRLIGGVGLRRGRRHPTDLRVGDALDFWRVVALQPGRQLTLLAEMRLPGSAVLEFTVETVDAASSRLVTTARFHPNGAWGLAYWYALAPAHYVIFRRMPQRMARAAERRYRAERQRARS